METPTVIVGKEQIGRKEGVDISSKSLVTNTQNNQTSGAENGSSLESPVNSLPPKPSFSFTNTNSRNVDSGPKHSPQILGIKLANIPHPTQPRSLLLQQQKKVIQQHIEKVLAPHGLETFYRDWPTLAMTLKKNGPIHRGVSYNETIKYYEDQRQELRAITISV